MSYRILVASAVSVISMSQASGAIAGPTYDTASGGTFTYYGQFSPAVISFDDGLTSNSELVDNASSNSRFGMWLRQPFGENELRFRFEAAFGLRQSSGVSQISRPDAISWNRTNIRHVDLQYETPNYGTFYLGQGSMASDGIGDRTLAGTRLTTAVAIGDIAGGYQFRTSAGALSGITVRNAFVSLDGARRGRIRYDTPTFSGFTVSIAYGQDILTSGNNDDFYDIGLGYKSEVGNGVKIEAGLGHQVRKRAGAPNQEDTFGSFTFILPSGFNATVSAGERSTNGDFYYVKLGYRRKLFGAGETAFAVEYYNGNDFVSVGGKANTYGIGVTQDIDRLNLEAYLGYRDYSYSDTSGTSYRDAQSLAFGARWMF